MESYSQIPASIRSKYTINEKLGQGAFGKIYLIQQLQSNSLYALKLMNLNKLITKQRNTQVRESKERMIKAEREIMMKFNHPNLIKCYDCQQQGGYQCLILQYCAQGSLYDKIQREGAIPEKDSRGIMRQLLEGFKMLHSEKVIHRDLKTENILIHDGVYKIADFGAAKVMEEFLKDSRNTIVGSRCTMAPEVLKGEEYGVQADMWSLAVIYFEMLTGLLPFENVLNKNQQDSLNDRILKLDISQGAKQFLNRALVQQPWKRITWSQLYKMKDSNIGLFYQQQSPISSIKPNPPIESVSSVLPAKLPIVQEPLPISQNANDHQTTTAILLLNTNLSLQQYAKDISTIALTNSRIQQIKSYILQCFWQNNQLVSYSLNTQSLKELLLLLAAQCIRFIEKYKDYTDFNDSKPGRYSSLRIVSTQIQKLNQLARYIYGLYSSILPEFTNKKRQAKDYLMTNAVRRVLNKRSLEQKFYQYLVYSCTTQKHLTYTLKVSQSLLKKHPQQLYFMTNDYKNIVFSEESPK